MYSDKEIRDWKLRHCRLYDGSQESVYKSILEHGMSFSEPHNGYKEDKTDSEINEILAIFYANERVWVELDENNKHSRNQYTVAEFESNLGADFETEDDAPRDLQVLLYLGFIQFMDGVYNRFTTQYEVNLFRRYYKEYYKPILTQNQKRDKERRPKLIDKCLYYKGEDINPWEYCYSPVLVWRKEIWDIEKEWVEAMICSYQCPQSSKELIRQLVLEEFFRSKDVAISLLNLILLKEKEKIQANNGIFGPIEAIQVCDKYKCLAPLGRDHRMYFAFYKGEEDMPSDYREEYQRMGWSQEKLQLSPVDMMTDFDSKEFQRRYRGKEGIWGWYADPKFPRLQKEVVFFACCNWGTWCPYSDVDKLGEEYLNYHYPGDGRPKHSDKFYHEAAMKAIENEKYIRTVRKCGIYQNKRVYQPIYTEEYKRNPVPIGLPLVILVDEDGKTEYIRSQLTFSILDSIRNKKY